MTKHLTFLPLIFSCILNLISAARIVPDLEASASIASDYKVQSVSSGSSGKYGYPYLIAPTLGPAIQARSDDDEKRTILVAKPFGSRIAGGTDGIVKKGNPKKSKVLPTQEAARRQDGEEERGEKKFRSYHEPKYRNFEELEAEFSPRRRIDLDSPYSQYEYKLHRKPPTSPRDPYLSPSSGPIDGFYPVPKIKPSYSSYGSHGSHGYGDGPSYGAGKYDDSAEYHGGSYGGPSSSYHPSGGDADVSYASGGHSPSGGSYGYGDFAIKSNEPIMGDIRKKLLDYAGASDLYEGEPDYLREVGRKKYKYGSLGNDYYSYGGQGYRDSYKEFPYVESKISLIKKSRAL